MIHGSGAPETSRSPASPRPRAPPPRGVALPRASPPPRKTRSSRELPDSSRERSRRSATMRDSRIASRSSCTANRATSSGSSSTTCRRVSAAAWIVAAGVLSSWDAFATKSRRTASSWRCSVTSRTTTRVAPSAAGVIVPRSQRVGTPVSTRTEFGFARARLSSIAVRKVKGSTESSVAGVVGRWRPIASFEKATCASDPIRRRPSSHRRQRQVPDPAVLDRVELLLPADRLGREGPLLPPPRRSRRAMPAERTRWWRRPLPPAAPRSLPTPRSECRRAFTWFMRRSGTIHPSSIRRLRKRHLDAGARDRGGFTSRSPGCHGGFIPPP